MAKDFERVVIDRNITTVLNYLLFFHMKKETLNLEIFRERVYTVPELNLMTYFTTYYVQKGHPLWNIVSEKLYYVHASGLPSKLMKDYFTEQLLHVDRGTVKPLPIESKQIPGLILFTGFVLSCAFLAVKNAVFVRKYERFGKSLKYRKGIIDGLVSK